MVQNMWFEFKDAYKIEDLRRIMELLRSEKGCPWDREQNHKSIRANLLEEAYEAVDAVDRANDTDLCEELGDVLLQVVFHARMAEEEGSFTLDDVADGICKKLILRHPHVFGEVKVSDSAEVLDNWDRIKRVEKKQETALSTLDSVPKAFPALMRAQKVGKRAAKAGFDWDAVDGAFDKITEETDELRAAISSGKREDMGEELGDLLFSIVNVARFLKLDAEDALQSATNKFIDRFGRVERLAASRGLDMETAGIDALDDLWNEVK